MIARLIAWSARNLLLVFFGAGFAAAAGIYALSHLPLDAIPDLSDTQVIVYTEYPGQAPQVIEDQVTYPLTTAMLTVPRSKVVRGFSFFGVSFVYVIFEDGTDIYWARSRVLEFLNSAASRLPAGVTPTMGPDATGVGWVYQYAVMSKELNLSDTRTIQDWNLKFALAKAEGVAEVASVGGFVRQYNVILDPQRMRDLGITMQKMRDAIRASNADVGGRTVELSEFEYVIRGKGYLKGINDLGNIVLKTSNGTPVLLRDIARVELGPDERRGITELNGEGEVASGIVLQRFGVNALDVIENVKKRFKEIASSLPKSVEIVAVYDRSNLINAAIETLKHTLLEESIVVALVCIVFLLAFPQRAGGDRDAAGRHPDGVRHHEAIGAWRQHHESRRHRDCHRRHDRCGHRHDRERPQASRAGRAGASAGRGADRGGFRGRAGAVLQPADHHRFLHADLHAGIAGGAAVQPARLHQDVFDGGGGAVVGDAGAGADGGLRPRPDRSGAQESDQPIPDLDLSARDRRRDARQGAGDPRLIGHSRGHDLAGAAIGHRVHAEPERRHAALYADHLAGHFRDQGGRIVADAGQDHPVIPGSGFRLRQGGPRLHRHRSGAIGDVRDHHQPEAEGGMAAGGDDRKPHAEMDRALQFPGVSNAWTMPIKSRIDMLSTGIRTPVGVKVIGTDLVEIDKLAKQIEQVIKTVPGTSSAYAERALGGYYLDVTPDRAALARYGIMVQDVQDVIATALGGQTVTTTVEGRQRFTVNMRYPRDLRSNPQAIASDVLVPLPNGGAVPLGEVAKVAPSRGPTSIRTENGQLAVYIYVDIRDRDLGGYVADAQAAVKASIQFPAGSYVVWSGQYEYLERAAARLKIVVPVTLAIIFLLLYLNFRSFTDTMIVMLSLPFALVGGIWLMWWLGFNLSVAVVVGFIALAGVAAETGVVMLIYLNHALAQIKARRAAEGRALSRADLYDAIMEGAVERVRPKMMTVVAIMAGLLPIMWSTGTGSEIMQRIAVPMIGGMISSTLLTLIVIPAIYGIVNGFRLRDEGRVDSQPPSPPAESIKRPQAVPEPAE